jgi:hypothetical protein
MSKIKKKQQRRQTLHDRLDATRAAVEEQVAEDRPEEWFEVRRSDLPQLVKDAHRGRRTDPANATAALTERGGRAAELAVAVLKVVGRRWPNDYFGLDGRFDRREACKRVKLALEARDTLDRNTNARIEEQSEILCVEAAEPLQALVDLFHRATLDVRTLMTHSEPLEGWTRAECEAERQEALAPGDPARLYREEREKRRPRDAAAIEQARQKLEADDQAHARHRK